MADNIIYYDKIDPSCDSVQRVLVGIKVKVVEAHAEYDTETGRVHKLETVAIKEITQGAAAYGILQANDILNTVTVDGVTYDITRSFTVIDAMLTARKSAEMVSTVSFNITRGGVTSDVVIDISGVELTPA